MSETNTNGNGSRIKQRVETFADNPWTKFVGRISMVAWTVIGSIMTMILVPQYLETVRTVSANERAVAVLQNEQVQLEKSLLTFKQRMSDAEVEVQGLRINDGIQDQTLRDHSRRLDRIER